MVIGVTNLKGGVGKTTLSVNIAVCLAHLGYQVTIVDTDNNQNSMSWYAAREEGLPQVLVVGATEVKAITKAVGHLAATNDIIVIDGTPNLSEMNSRIMLASDMLLIPTRPGAHDFRAMEQFIERLEQVRQFKEVKAYFIINEFDPRVILHNFVLDQLKTFDVPILATMLKSRTAFGEATLQGLGAYEHNDQKARNEIIALTNEIMKLAQEEFFES